MTLYGKYHMTHSCDHFERGLDESLLTGHTQSYIPSRHSHFQLERSLWSPPIYVCVLGYLHFTLASRHKASTKSLHSQTVVPLELNPSQGIIIHKLRPRETLRRLALLHPLNNGGQDIALRIKRDTFGSSATALSQNPSARTGAAVEHSWDTEEAVVIVQLWICVGHVVPETIRVEARDLVVLSTVVADNLAAALLELGEGPGVGPDIGWVQAVGLADKILIVIAGVPTRIAKDDITEPILCYSEAALKLGRSEGVSYHGVAKRLAGQELLHSLFLIPRIHPRKDEGSVVIGVGGVDFLDLLNLLGTEAARTLARLTEQSMGVKEALAWDFNDPILNPVDAIALPKDLVVYETHPGIGSDEVLRVNGSRYGIEHGPLALEFVEVNGRSARNDAVVVLGESLGSLDAHASAERAAEIVRVCRFLIVELFDELLG